MNGGGKGGFLKNEGSARKLWMVLCYDKCFFFLCKNRDILHPQNAAAYCIAAPHYGLFVDMSIFYGLSKCYFGHFLL